jgi:hypothetical protein
MPLLIINHTTDKTFSFTLNKKVFTLEPGSKNIIDAETCPAEIRKYRSTGEIFINTVTSDTVAFYKALGSQPVAEKEAVVEKEVVAEDPKLPKQTKTNEKES